MNRVNKARTSNSIRRAKPVVPKAGVTRDGKRRYGQGGKLKCKCK